MRILVTGSSGFVGRALTREFRQRGHHVTGLSRKGGDLGIKSDLLDPASLERAIEEAKPQVIYNLAAVTDLKGAPQSGYRVNTDGVSNLIASVARAPSVERVIWMSSQLVHRPGLPFSSPTTYEPVGAYGESKAEGERRVRASDGGGRVWAIVRTPTIWGPGMSEHYLGAIRMIQRGLYFHAGTRPLPKSCSYIDNLVAQLASLADAPDEAVHRKLFYLADSEPLDIRAWADAFAAKFGKRIPTLPLPVARSAAKAGDILRKIGLPAPLTSDRLGNLLNCYVHDTGAIEAIHGWTQVDWKAGVDRTYAWIRQSEQVDGSVEAALMGR